MRQKYGDAVLRTPIRTSSSLAVASRDGRTVFDAKNETRGAVDYRAAALEIAAGLEAEPAAPAVTPTPEVQEHRPGGAPSRPSDGAPSSPGQRTALEAE